MDKVIVNTDGGSRGNPGPAAIGVVIALPSGEVIEKSRFIGRATNNQAEYRALLLACQIVEGEVIGQANVEYRLDSELVVKQMNGDYKIKDADLAALKSGVDAALRKAGYQFSFVHVPRVENAVADKLVNKALNLHAKSGRR